MIFETDYMEGAFVVAHCPDGVSKTRVYFTFDNLDAKRQEQEHLLEVMDLMEAFGFYGVEQHKKVGHYWQLGNLWRNDEDQVITRARVKVLKPIPPIGAEE